MRTRALLVRFVLGALLAALGARPAAAQFLTRSWLDWRTIRTDHFLVHYPRELESWAHSLAAQMEAVHRAVADVVGSAPAQRVQIVVDDPYAQPNGSAWPFLDKPVILAWASPPTPRDDIGTFTHWGQLLAVHEFAHIAQLTRPSRNPMASLLSALLPVQVGPLARKSPQWLIEGYATHVEGVITGSARPNGSWRPAILRQWALEGQLPTYDQLNQGTVYLGGELTNLAGSAFIDWLVATRGDSTLGHLWRRMSAREDRSFIAAFEGVYGETPATLYGRFTAELTAHAAETRKGILAGKADTGILIQHLTKQTGDPAISSDGGKVALVLRSATRPPRVVIWTTVPERDTAAERRSAAMMRRDPDDVAARPIYPVKKKVLAELPGVGNSAYQGPRFFRDGRVLVWRHTAQGDGSFRPDLFIWDPQRNDLRRVTHGAGIRDGDPSPDGRTAVATQCLGGRCALVLVDLTTGAVRQIGSSDAARTYYRPRYSPDGSSIIVSVHDGYWQLAWLSADGAFRGYAGPKDAANRYDAAFIDSITVVAVSDYDGFPNIERINLRSGAAVWVARVAGAAVAPEPNPADGSVWFLSMHSRGLDLRAITDGVRTRGGGPIEVTAFPLTSRRTPVLVPQPALPTSAFREFALGSRQWRWVPAGFADADGSGATLAVVNSDVIGRTEFILQGSLGSHGSWRGWSATVTSRSTRPEFATMLFGATRNPVDRAERPGVGETLIGGLGTADYVYGVERSSLRASGGFSTGTIAYGGASATQRTFGFAQLGGARRHFGDGPTTTLSAKIQGFAGRTGEYAVRRAIASAALTVSGAGPLALNLSAMHGRASTLSAYEHFTLGGSLAPSLHPSLQAQHVALPAIAFDPTPADRVTTYRAALPISGIELFTLGAMARSRGGGENDLWHRADGVEWNGSLPSTPAAGFPAVRATIGVARTPTEGAARVRGYVFVGIGDWWR